MVQALGESGKAEKAAAGVVRQDLAREGGLLEVAGFAVGGEKRRGNHKWRYSDTGDKGAGRRTGKWMRLKVGAVLRG